jgi:hypothetical protein
MHTIGQLTAAVISEQLERAAGSPEAAAAHPERFCEAIAAYAGVEPHEGLQLVHPLAFLYATEFSGNRWFRNPALLEAARAAGWRLLAWMRETRDHTPVRRKGHPLVRAFALLRADLPDQAEWKAGISEVIGRLFLPLLRERERLTVLTSANVGYGTNHLACELSAVTAYLRAFRNDPDFGRMDPGGPGLEDYLRGWLARFMDHQATGRRPTGRPTSTTCSPAMPCSAQPWTWARSKRTARTSNAPPTSTPGTSFRTCNPWVSPTAGTIRATAPGSRPSSASSPREEP